MTAVRYVREVRFQVLGPLRVTADGEDLPLGGPQQRLVLALLVAARGRTVSTDSLIQGVWGEEMPPTARKALQGYVHHLRTGIGDRLKTETGGYSLDTGGEVDAAHFEQLRNEASDLLESDPQGSAQLLREALGLWQGPAYADVSDHLALVPEVARLENLRLAAVGDRIDADLALGRHETLIGELKGLTLEHPFQERFWAQHMTALYRSGRQTEALRSYDRLRRFLADESGLEPSEELQQLEERILSQDSSLAVDAEADTVSDPAVIRGYEFREKVASDAVSDTYRAYQRSVGRQVAVRVIGPRLANDPVFIANFLSDTQRVATVDHPHISYVFDTWREPGKAYQVSRWLGGGTLEEVSSGGVSSTLSVLGDVGDALSHAHRHGVAHGSVDASHVLLDESGHPYLTGFSVGFPQSDDALARDRLDFAVLAHRLIGGRPPREIDGHLQPDLDDTSLARVFEVAFSDEGYGRIEDFLRAMRQGAGADVVASTPPAPPRTEVRNPYKGLKAFQEADASDFYGRDELIDRLEETLNRRRLVAVVGPSGSGKSSVVKAGLLPRLRSEPELRLFTEMYPGAFPFEELEGALLRIGVDRTSLIEDLISDDRGLLRVLKQIIPSDNSELVLIIDQFEELFSTVDDQRTRRLFLDSLVNAVSEPRSRLRVVITMRADFFDRPLEHPRFGELLEAGLIPITLPDDDQLAQATVMPARSEGVEFEDGLVSQIVSDVSGQPGGLPLLQYALTEVFEARDSDVLTLAAYQRSGGVHGALGRRAEDIHEDLTPAQQTSVREAFLRMVSVDENADDLRRRVRRSDLAGIGSQKDLDAALQAYAAARLVTFDRDPVTRGPTVEVAHEALLREWGQLRDWIEEQRDDLVIRRRLDTALEEWKQSGEDDGYLPSGSRLAHFEEWAGETELVLSGPERAFLQAGVEREAERRARAARRRRWVMTGFGVAAVVASVFALAALRNASTANAEALAAAAIEQIDEDPERSVLLSLQSLELAETPNGLTALHQALQNHRTMWVNHGPRGPLYGGYLHPDGEHVLTVTGSGTAQYWDTTADAASPIWEAEVTGGDSIDLYRAWFHVDQHQVTIPVTDLGMTSPPTSSGEHRGLYTLDLETGDVLNYEPIDGCLAAHWFPPWSPDVDEPALQTEFVVEQAGPEGGGSQVCEVGVGGMYIEHPDEENAIELDLPATKVPLSFTFSEISADGTVVVFGVFGSAARSYVFDATTGQPINDFEGAPGVISPEGASVLVQRPGFVELRDVETGELLMTFPGDFSWTGLTPDERHMVGLSFEQGVEVFDVTTGRPLLELVGPETRPVSMRFAGNSDRVLVAYPGSHRLWNLAANTTEIQGLLSRVIPQSNDSIQNGGVRTGGGLLHVPGLVEGEFGYSVHDVSSGALVREQSEVWEVSRMSPDGSVILETPVLENEQSAAPPDSVWYGIPRLVAARTGAVVAELPSTCSYFAVGNANSIGNSYEPGPDCTENDVFLPISDIEFSADSSMLALDTVDGKPTVFDLTTDEVVWSTQIDLQAFRAPRSIALSHDGTTVAYGLIPEDFNNPEFPLVAVDIPTGSVIGRTVTPGLAFEAHFSADGHRLYIADDLSDVGVLDTETWAEIARLGRGQGGSLQDIAITGDIAATVGADNVVRAWDLATEDVLLEVRLGIPVSNVEFIDESHIMVVTLDGEILIFTLDPEELKSIALDRLTRGLSEEECSIYDIDPCPTLEEMRNRATS